VGAIRATARTPSRPNGPAKNGPPPLQTVEIGKFLDMKFETPTPIMPPLFNAGTQAMLYGNAGAGKTYLMQAMGIATAYKVPLLGWQPEAPSPVLYVDGEMQLVEMQNRSRALLRGILETIDHIWEPFHLVTADLQPHGIGKLDSPAGAQALFDLVDRLKPRLVILDNLSCLTSPEDDNSSASWNAVQELLLAMRRRHIAVLVGHHSGKSGQQRGTSRKADILDVILRLSPIANAENDGRTRVLIEFEKGRALKAEDKVPFEACLEPDQWGGLTWTRAERAIPQGDRIRQMLLDGMSPGDIAAEVGTARSFVYRLQGELIETGVIQPRKSSRKQRNPAARVPCPLLREGDKGTTHGASEGRDKGQRRDIRGQIP